MQETLSDEIDRVRRYLTLLDATPEELDEYATGNNNNNKNDNKNDHENPVGDLLSSSSSSSSSSQQQQQRVSTFVGDYSEAEAHTLWLHVHHMHRTYHRLPWWSLEEEQHEFLLFWGKARKIILGQGLVVMSGGGGGEMGVSGGGANSNMSNKRDKRDLYDLSQQQRQHNNNSNSATGYLTTSNNYPPQLHNHNHGPVRDPYASRADPSSPHDHNHLHPPASPSSPPVIMKRPNRDPYAQYYESKNEINEEH